MNKSLIILEDSAYFRKGQVLNEYQETEEGVIISEKFVKEGNYVILNEKINPEDENRIRELIRQQLKLIFWNLYTKQSSIVGNL